MSLLYEESSARFVKKRFKVSLDDLPEVGIAWFSISANAALEILSLHEKPDELREMKSSELITMQQEQLRLLTQLMKEHYPPTSTIETLRIPSRSPKISKS